MGYVDRVGNRVAGLGTCEVWYVDRKVTRVVGLGTYEVWYVDRKGNPGSRFGNM